MYHLHEFHQQGKLLLCVWPVSSKICHTHKLEAKPIILKRDMFSGIETKIRCIVDAMAAGSERLVFCRRQAW